MRLAGPGQALRQLRPVRVGDALVGRAVVQKEGAEVALTAGEGLVIDTTGQTTKREKKETPKVATNPDASRAWMVTAN